MLGALPRLLIGLEPEGLGLPSPASRSCAQRSDGPIPTSASRSLARLLEVHRSRRLQIPAGDRIDQPGQLLDHLGVELEHRPARYQLASPDPAADARHPQARPAPDGGLFGQPVRQASSATPPGPCVLASLAAHSRRRRLSHSGPNTASTRRSSPQRHDRVPPTTAQAPARNVILHPCPKPFTQRPENQQLMISER